MVSLSNQGYSTRQNSLLWNRFQIQSRRIPCSLTVIPLLSSRYVLGGRSLQQLARPNSGSHHCSLSSPSSLHSIFLMTALFHFVAILHHQGVVTIIFVIQRRNLIWGMLAALPPNKTPLRIQHETKIFAHNILAPKNLFNVSQMA